MIADTINRNEESSKRLALRSNTSTFAQVVENGTSCSAFESSVIAEKAVECFGLGPHSLDAEMQPGQMKWKAISALEPAGKPLKECTFKLIVLTTHNIEEDKEVYDKFGNSAKRAHQIIRMCNEAYDQETLLTQEDLSLILGSDIRTIRKDIKAPPTKALA